MKPLPTIGLLLLFFAAALPAFFDTYRTAAFDTVPRDDYAPYLLTLVGEANDVPKAPFAYRVVSVAVAVPFYYALPTYRFSKLQDVDPTYLKATQALAFSSYFWLVLTSLAIYAIARRRCGASKAASVIAALASFVLSGFISKTGVDPFAIFTISLLILWLERLPLFAPMILLSVGINEKVPILFAALLLVRFYRPGSAGSHRLQLLLSALAAIAYFAVVFTVRVPGIESQTDPRMFPANFVSSLVYTFTLKGLVLNALPVCVLGVVAVAAARGAPRTGYQPVDVSGMLLLLTLAMVADVAYNVGRVVMYAYPLYVPAAAVYIDEMMEK